MYNRFKFKLSHHHHSGRVQPHEYTSYFPLTLLLFVVGVALLVTTVSAAPPGPEAGYIGLSGAMPGPVPTTAATIDTPSQGQRFNSTPVTVSGTCPKTTLVQVYKNDIFAGSTTCSDEGTYTIDIDLLVGQNILIARVYNALNEPGPDSAPVTVFYDALPSQASSLAPLNFGGAQLVLNTDTVYRGLFPNKEFSMPIDIVGGTPPYAIDVQWGDSTNKVVPRNDNVPFKVSHTYTKPGVYQITLQGTDSQERVAFLTVAAFINGQPDAAALATAEKASTNKLLALWPLYTSLATIVLSFWLGERREKRILMHHPQLLQT